MHNSRIPSRVMRRGLITLLLLFGVTIVWIIALEAMRARQQGLDIAASVSIGLHFLPRALPWVLLAFALGVPLCLLMLRPQPVKAAPPTEAGRTMWRRLRIWTTLLAAIYVLITSVDVILDVAKGEWQGRDWRHVFTWILYGTILIAWWTQRPSPERLYALATGDLSRVNDERMQQVHGKAAKITLMVFMIVLLLGGAFHEMVVLGAWPVRTIVELVVLGLIWTGATTYWNRRL